MTFSKAQCHDSYRNKKNTTTLRSLSRYAISLVVKTGLVLSTMHELISNAVTSCLYGPFSSVLFLWAWKMLRNTVQITWKVYILYEYKEDGTNSAVFLIWRMPTILFTDLKGKNQEIVSVERSIQEK